MTSSPHHNLPFFDRFNEVAADDTLFDGVLSGVALADLPRDDVFMVSHRSQTHNGTNRGLSPVCS